MKVWITKNGTINNIFPYLFKLKKWKNVIFVISYYGLIEVLNEVESQIMHAMGKCDELKYETVTVSIKNKSRACILIRLNGAEHAY